KMSEPVQIRMGGYGPPTTTCSRGMSIMGEALAGEFGKAVDVKYIWNVMDLGYKGGDLLWMAEHGILTLSYQSTSYLADRVPELDVADLPFLFEGLEDARAAMDGAFGAWMTRKIEERIPGYRVLGYFENGYRHVSNRLRPVRALADLKGMRVRLMPGQVHARSFESMGAIPHSLDLKPGLEAVMSGAVDAQENPLANTVDYGAHKVHRYHTLTGHCYLSRGIYMNRAEFDRWPKALQEGIRRAARKAVLAQRDLAIAEENVARKAIESAGGEVLALAPEERAAFARAVQPLHDEARKRFGEEVFGLLRRPG
ncbi:MAG TPA: TRAP transporter substrate-binding protein, partial [Burkholderiales bacterium]|nr:TRAP transporter substrate-binding protein [Burkholderiales bacterium]